MYCTDGGATGEMLNLHKIIEFSKKRRIREEREKDDYHIRSAKSPASRL